MTVSYSVCVCVCVCVARGSREGARALACYACACACAMIRRPPHGQDQILGHPWMKKYSDGSLSTDNMGIQQRLSEWQVCVCVCKVDGVLSFKGSVW